MFAASKTSKAASGVVPDQYFDYVTALLNTSGTNGAQNNTFIDSSTNNFTITRNGNTTQGSFSPFGENWSNYFDGSGDSLNTPASANFAFGTGDFTAEFWVTFTTVSGRQDMVWWGVSASDRGGIVYNELAGNLTYYISPTVGRAINYAWTPSINTWYHIALVRSSGSSKLYLNGAQVGSTYADSKDYASSSSLITVAKDNSAASSFLFGSVSNLRIVKGRALYTSNFTPSTTPLQPVSGTSLLTCQSPGLVDDSPNQFTITRAGDVSVQKFGPFASTTLPTPYYGAYFDGTGDYLTVGSSTVLALGAGDWTIEAWVNPASVAIAQNIIFDWRSTNNTLPVLYLVNNQVWWRSDSATKITSSSTLNAGTWYHVAVARSSTTTTMYINGTSVGSYTDTVNYANADFKIGKAWDSNFWNGSISNARIVKGQALYTSNFTPSTVPLTTASQGATPSNVSLLTCQSSTFIDNSTNNFTITAVGNTRPTTTSPFTVTYASQQSYSPAVFGGSGYFDGTGDWLTVASPTSALNTGATYTIEAYVYPTVLNTTNMVFTYTNNNVSSFGGWLLWFNASGTITFECRPSTGGINVQVNGGTVLRNSWSHIAVSVSSNAVKLFLNGVQVQTGTVVAVDGTQNNMAIGALTNGAPAGPFNGYISNARLVVGTALYASAFVPPTAPLTPITNTRLLINSTNAGIYDAATLNDFETVGNAQVSTSVKKYGTSSMAFDGSGDSLDVKPVLPSLFSQKGSYTIEAWIYPTSLSVSQYFYSQVTTNFLQLAISSSGFLQVDRSGVGVAITSSSALTLNTWQYVTLVSDGTNLRLYINGTQSGSTVSVGTQVDPSSAIIRIGAYQNGGGAPSIPFYGYIQDFRITRGIARYTTTFTPPAAALPTF